MSRPKKTVEQRKATRERILAAASELLEKRGSEEISIRAVTAGLGISPMGFYSYFTSLTLRSQADRVELLQFGVSSMKSMQIQF